MLAVYPRVWVYPRVCGGTAYCALRMEKAVGLSPRVRGNPPPQCPSAPPSRSIPACAGEPATITGGSARRTVYPRVCGGTRYRCQTPSSISGLSPRVRGNRRRATAAGHRKGSIPACAGEPHCCRPECLLRAVYPRVCGGTRGCPDSGRTSSGLSPRVRGNRPAPRPGWSSRGSIPACAGEPHAASNGAGGLGVYPRVCGGTTASLFTTPPIPGLSPRVRGNPTPGKYQDSYHRSIPACAGEPWAWKDSAAARRVYPRVCGGTHNVRYENWRTKGLSPRVRGNPSRVPASYTKWRSIPACAGEPMMGW